MNSAATDRAVGNIAPRIAAIRSIRATYIILTLVYPAEGAMAEVISLLAKAAVIPDNTVTSPNRMRTQPKAALRVLDHTPGFSGIVELIFRSAATAVSCTVIFPLRLTVAPLERVADIAEVPYQRLVTTFLHATRAILWILNVTPAGWPVFGGGAAIHHLALVKPSLQAPALVLSWDPVHCIAVFTSVPDGGSVVIITEASGALLGLENIAPSVWSIWRRSTTIPRLPEVRPRLQAVTLVRCQTIFVVTFLSWSCDSSPASVPSHGRVALGVHGDRTGFWLKNVAPGTRTVWGGGAATHFLPIVVPRAQAMTATVGLARHICALL